MPSVYTDDDVTHGLIALAAWAGNVEACSRALRAEGKLEVPASTLYKWSRRHADRYNELREKYSEQLEQQLVHEYREVARQAVDVQKQALENAMRYLKSGTDKDPGRTAANAARVAQSMTDKMLALSGRPTSIREDRNTNEILRSLVARGVLQLPEGEPIDGTVHGTVDGEEVSDEQAAD